MRFLGHFCCDSCANYANSSYGSKSCPKLDGMIRNYKLDFRNMFLLSVHIFLLCASFFGLNVVTSLAGERTERGQEDSQCEDHVFQQHGRDWLCC